MLVLELPSERILLASESARSLLAPDGAPVVGLTLDQLTGPPTGDAGALLCRGHLNGYADRRPHPHDDDAELRLWVRSDSDGADRRSGAATPVLVLLGTGPASPVAEPPPTVAGVVDRQLVLEQVSDGFHQFPGQPPETVLGQSLLGLVDPDDLPSLLFAIGQATAGEQAVALPVTLLRHDHARVLCQLVLLPLSPAPSFAFALQPVPELAAGNPTLTEFRQLLQRFGHGISVAATARELPFSNGRLRPMLAELTSRELQIVHRLAAGDRVPAIAQQLYLAQSTVRNHLSAVFAKLGVRSQQELIVLLRRTNAGRL